MSLRYRKPTLSRALRRSDRNLGFVCGERAAARGRMGSVEKVWLGEGEGMLKGGIWVFWFLSV